MHSILKKLNASKTQNCLTIALNTHRTSPDNKQDIIVLKNLMKEAEIRLQAEVSKENADKIITNLNEIAQTIDHNYNSDSLLLFANENMADYVKLPIKLKQRVQLDQSFATRDLVRALHLEKNYYILMLSQHTIRLIEASNDQIIQEFGNPFPIQNKELHPESRMEKTDSARQNRLLSEYFNRVDKEVQNIWKAKPRPILICSDTNNRIVFESVTDRKESLMSITLSGNRLDDKAQTIVADAWQIVKEDMFRQNASRKTELEKSLGSGNFLSDEGEIWRAIHEGKIQTLFLEETKMSPGIIDGNNLFINQLPDINNNQKYVDDIYDEMVEAVYAFGGETIFLAEGSLAQFQGIAATTRY